MIHLIYLLQMSTPSPDPTDLSTPKKVAFVSCETQTFKINIGIGDQSIKWLALAAAAKIADQRRGRGRITSRSPNVDGRLNVLPVPQCVTVGRSKKWLHPNIKITEVQARFGSTCILMVDLALLYLIFFYCTSKSGLRHCMLWIFFTPSCSFVCVVLKWI